MDQMEQEKIIGPYELSLIHIFCEPDVGLANADFIGYSTPITAVWEMLDDDLKYSEIRCV